MKKRHRQAGLFGKAVTVPKSDLFQNTDVVPFAEELARELEKSAAIRLDPFRYLPYALRPATLASVVHAQRELWSNLFAESPIFGRARAARPENREQLELL